MYFRDKVFRVVPQTQEQAVLIQKMDKNFKLDFWHPDTVRHVTPQMTVDFHVNVNHSESVQLLLEQNTVKYEVLFHNLQEGIEAQLDIQKLQKSNKHRYDIYNDWEKISDWTSKMASKYPTLVKRLEIGKTFEGHPMYLLKVGKQKTVPKSKAIFMDCGIHAREWISPAFCQWFVKELIKGRSKDRIIKRLVNRLDFYILPVFNVDGYVWSWTEDRMWRKNRSPEPSGNCFGTDLNRNFNISWCEVGSEDDPCSDIYCGPSAESEKETKTIASFIQRHANTIKAYISIHSYSQMLLYPYAYTYELPPNAKDLDSVATVAVSRLRSLYGTKYTYGPSASTIYPTSGSSDDWAYTQGIKYSFTFELRDQGEYGFLLPESQIKHTCKETTLAVKYIANYVLGHSP
ncbi:mast cell carboxypeptidase A-like [Spea bombifrons]|uniref:mast cell carboxypeptidase A-like n=1 Tax=Spea bombifrons TaxID=233779 RepID=UPI0023492D0F|nr:mast cell carboxypeptidase A-like [Spea bombifrons]